MKARGTTRRSPRKDGAGKIAASRELAGLQRAEEARQRAEAGLRQALAEQTATAEILRVMAGSPADVQPVFDAIAASAGRLCEASFCVVFRFDGELITVAADDGRSPGTLDVIRAAYPAPPGMYSMSARAILERRVISIADAQSLPDHPRLAERARAIGYRSILVVPMMKGDAAIGTINVVRFDVQPFSDAQIELLKTFAAQAVIAIENVRLLNETREALERQTATADILRVISNSPTETQPVFEAIVQAGVRLFEGAAVAVTRPEEGEVRLMAIAERDPLQAQKWRERFPFPLNRDYMHGAAILDGEMIDVAEIEALEGRFAAGKRNFTASGYRAMTIVPMVKDGKAIGTVAVIRIAPGPLNDKQIALLKTFADQAVIAIENVRLFNETRESLEQQRASGEVLSVISSSIADTAPVFDKILESCQRLFAGTIVGLNLMGEDGKLHIGAYHGAHRQEFERIFPIPLDPDSGSGLAIVERRVVHYPDAANEAEVPARTRQGCRAIGIKSVIFAPVVWEGRGLGAIFVGRDQVSTFSEKEIALLRTFADQAAIAIENVRLFNETKEALEQQTATAEILKVTSASPADVKPVFEAMLAHASNLCEASVAAVFLYDGEVLTNVAQRNASPEFAGFMRGVRSLPSLDTTCRRCALERRTIHTPDLLSDPEFAPPEAHRRENIRTVLSVPMLREGSLVGVITLWRREVRPFTAKQISLVETFAQQAVLALESVRLFNETKEALEQQTATAEILQVIGSSPTDAQPVFDAIVNSGVRLFPGAMITVARPDGGTVQAAAIAHEDTTMVAGWRERFATPLSRDRLHAAAILDAKLIDFPDAEAEKDGPIGPGVRNFLLSGNRAITIMPMLRGEGAIGAISVTRAVPGPLSDKQIAILRTFADQAVIAIENVRLFNEIQEKSRQLEIASRHKSEFLANMSHELRTPLNAIIGFTRIVMRKAKERLEPLQYENLEKILSSGQNLLALINSILDLSKIEAGHIDVRPAAVGLAPVLEQCLRTVEPLVKSETVSLVKEFDGGLPEMYVDEEKLRQIVINLLSNAAKFTERGTIRLRAQAANGSVSVAVADTGIGIPEDKLELIFEEFEQVDASSTRAHGGTGLGLTIARRLARLMGGDLRAQSRFGSGSTFTVTLPLRYAA